MNTKQLLALTLLTTALTLNAALPKEFTLTYKQQANSLSTALANILYKRGIEKEKALEISKDFTSENEELFTLMLHNFINHSSFTQEQVLEQLSVMTLQRKNINLSSYSSLVQLSQRVSKTVLDDDQLKILELISQKNSTLRKVFA